MAVHDSIGDMLTTVRNGAQRGAATVRVVHSKMHASILTILKRYSYIYDFKVVSDEEKSKKAIIVYLVDPAAAEGSARKITKLIRVSRPGLRRYVGVNEIPRVLNGLGISILSTSRGLKDGFEARKLNMGGELIAKVW